MVKGAVTQHREYVEPAPEKPKADDAFIGRLDLSINPTRDDGAPRIPDIAHLGVRGSLYLLALVKAHHECQRVTPTNEGTCALIATLQTLGIVRLTVSQERGAYITVGDRVMWSYTWDATPFAHLEHELSEHLMMHRATRQHAATWLSVWQELLVLEVKAYFQNQLRLHSFDPQLAAEIEPFLSPRESRYSLGQWRYACWATVRSMASTALQYPGNSEVIRFTLVDELFRRLRLTQDAPSDKLCFSPARSIPVSAITTIFSCVATNLGDEFWRQPPSLDAIETAYQLAS